MVRGNPWWLGVNSFLGRFSNRNQPLSNHHRIMVPRYYIPGHFIFSCHFIPKGKMHYIPNDTSSNTPLHPLVHFVPNGTSSQVHFISKGTSSHSVLHLISHFISQVISSHMLLHPIGHFIPPVTSSHTSLHTMTQSL